MPGPCRGKGLTQLFAHSATPPAALFAPQTHYFYNSTPTRQLHDCLRRCEQQLQQLQQQPRPTMAMATTPSPTPRPLSYHEELRAPIQAATGDAPMVKVHRAEWKKVLQWWRADVYTHLLLAACADSSGRCCCCLSGVSLRTSPCVSLRLIRAHEVSHPASRCCCPPSCAPLTLRPPPPCS